MNPAITLADSMACGRIPCSSCKYASSTGDGSATSDQVKAKRIAVQGPLAIAMQLRCHSPQSAHRSIGANPKVELISIPSEYTAQNVLLRTSISMLEMMAKVQSLARGRACS